MNILVTGCAGFIGFHTCFQLSKYKKYKVIGIDNLNNFYDQNLKKENKSKKQPCHGKSKKLLPFESYDE